MKKILFVLVFILVTWLNKFRVSYDFIREANWKNYKGHSRVFADAITFTTQSCNINYKGEIYSRDNIYLGKIVNKKHNYVNTFITVLDSANQTAVYIAK